MAILYEYTKYNNDIEFVSLPAYNYRYKTETEMQMEIILQLIGVTALAGVFGTGLGGAVGAFIKKDSSKMVSLFLSFAAGVMLSIVCFDLVPEALTESKPLSNFGVLLVIAGIATGYALVYALNTLIDKRTNREVKHIDKEHPKTADDLDELIHSNHLEAHVKENSVKTSSYQLFIAGIIMASAIALHNLPEGIVIGASFAGDLSEGITSKSGIVMATVIGLHNIPEGMAVSVPLISGNMNRFKAILITALTGAPTIIGAVIGYAIGAIGPLALCISLSFASGAMLYVVFGELLPESILMWRSKVPAVAALIGVFAGLIIIYM